MGYQLRAFCRSDDLPALGRVFETAAAQGMSLELADKSNPAALGSPEWRGAEVRYKSDKQPFVVDASRAGEGGVLSDEVQEFVELLDDVEDSEQKGKVLAQLQESRAVVGVQLLNDIDDDGYKAVGVFLSFYVEHCGGMIQADGEGFYEGDRLLVEVK